MNILLLGSGGREHALAWKLAQSPRCDKLYAAPGNPGIADHAELVALDVTDHAAVVTFCEGHHIGLVVIGPEAPLVDGLADSLRGAGFSVFGPSRAAAQLEGSKGFTKDLCARANIPTAGYVRATSLADARAALVQFGAPVVIKADGLAAGKGVVVAMTMAEAEAAVDDMFDGAFGSAGAEVVIEEFLEGEEASFFALTDGSTIVPFASAQDHKRVGDGDTGPNTGGMGAYSPATVLTPELEAQAMAQIIGPTVKTMADEGMPYSGVLYAGLMLTADGPKLIEYNARFGDPECQVLMMRLETDLVELLSACAENRLASIEPPRFSPDPALTIVVAAAGYPADPRKGGRIDGIPVAEAMGAKVFHAGTTLGIDGALTASGGRVLNVTTRAPAVRTARDLAYRAIYGIRYDDGFWRNDIAYRELVRFGNAEWANFVATRPRTIGEALRKRAAKRLVMFHCDHFEPWRNNPRTIGPENADNIALFAERMAALDHARNLTLFYRPHCKPVVAPRADGRFVDGDTLGFAPLNDKQLAITAPAIRTLVDAGHDIQIHIHHERVTGNLRYARTAAWADRFEAADAAAADAARLDLLVKLTLETARAESGLAMDEWLFVHGNWALAASDPRVCNVGNELEILARNGCVGDFTFTGAPHDTLCLPRFTQPSLVRPAHGAKAYDTAGADPIPAWGAGKAADAAQRLLVWATQGDAIAHSLDYETLPVAKRCENPEMWAVELAGRALHLGDTLYLPTYGHAMSPAHGTHDAMVFPHEHPAIRAMFGHLLDGAGQAGMAVDFLHAAQVRRQILAGGRGDGA